MTGPLKGIEKQIKYGLDNVKANNLEDYIAVETILCFR